MKTTAKCRNRCRSRSEGEPFMFPFDVENLHFYETAVRTTLCLLKCKNAAFKNKFVSVSPELDKLYFRKKPYEYLHLCYYQKKMLQKAASAAFTALVANPEENAMINNLKFYSSLPEVNMNAIENLEIKAFVPLYIQGVEAYNKGDFASVINLLEQSLKKWLRAAEECRAYCESPFDQGWFPDFISSVSNHFTFCLRCKQKCEMPLNSLNGEYHEDMLPSHYHYLQYSYYKVSKLQKACEAVESYLLFFPNEETMIKNKEFYSQYLNGNMDYFVPREEAVKYVQRQKYENQLLNFIDTEFKKIAEKMGDRDSEEETNVCLLFFKNYIRDNSEQGD
ncbi:Uncharacterized protein GBIM_04206 [Gryllus bimaculatus]|nr:Uncharacterized protein GBIM_04206 [Gryllus bimaculatus]